MSDAQLIDTDVLERTLRAALTNGGDFAEVYAEDRTSSSARLDDRRIEELVSGRSRGAGVRVVRDETTGFAHTTDLSEAGLLLAVEAAAAAARAGEGAARAVQLESRAVAPPHEVVVVPDGVPKAEKVALLERADAAQLRVVAVHQPAAVIRPEDRVNRLRGSAAALQRWSAAGADLVLGGHIHLPYVVAPPGLARAVWVVQAGTAVSNRLREAAPNSINVVRWGVDAPAGRCTIERWDHFAAAEAFARTAVMDVMPQRA
jgi:hypothetical protein